MLFRFVYIHSILDVPENNKVNIIISCIIPHHTIIISTSLPALFIISTELPHDLL